jgi:arginase
MVRVPRAWGTGGEAMAEAAHLAFDYPEAAVVEEDSLADQTLALAAELPDRPLVLGGCCSSHVGALEGLAARHDRIALVWLDAHGDLNTPETSPSGNVWGMPLRMVVDSGTVEPENVALIGARNLDPPEEVFIAESGLRTGPDAVEKALENCSCVYVALDVDSIDPSEITPFMPEPDGLTLDEVERLFAGLRQRATVIGAGLSGLAPDPANVPRLERLTHVLGL